MKLTASTTEKELAATWSGTAEPGDPCAGMLREALGAATALEWVLANNPGMPQNLPGGDALLPGIPWLECHARWHGRATDFDVHGALKSLRRIGGYLITPGDPNWPTQLDDLEFRAPPALWAAGEGDPEMLRAPSVSVVGARACSSYGRRTAGQLAYELSAVDIPVISGGAYGIDAAAHQGALDACEDLALPQQMATVAVICGGLANLYPAGHRELFDRIRKLGLVIAEGPPHWRPARWRFLERNRLIAALSQMTVIVEAGIRSGAVATANRAADLGREVGAVPGAVTSPSSDGCHELIRAGAQLIRGSDDVRATFGLSTGGSVDTGGPALPARLQIIFDALPLMGKARADSVAKAAGLSPTETSLALIELQLQGRVEALPDGWWERR